MQWTTGMATDGELSGLQLARDRIGNAVQTGDGDTVLRRK